MELHRSISDWVDAHRDELIADLSRLVAIKSVRAEPEEGMPYGHGCSEALRAAMDICEAYGLSINSYGGAVASADLCEAETAVDILGHLDVVGEGDGWDTDPYTAVEKDGCLYGRGTDDDKGPVTSVIYAMRCVRELGIPLKYNARLIIGTDEESGFSDLPYYYGEHAPAPHSFSPDSEFPVYNVEKGRYTPIFTMSWDEETALPRVASFDGGYRINILPADASAVVLGVSSETAAASLEKEARVLGVALRVEPADGGCRVSVSGRAAHAAHPEDGCSGLTALVSLLLLLPLANCDSTKALRALAEAFPHGDNAGRALGIAQSDEVSGELTVAFSLMCIDRHGVSCQFDSRVPICADDENCRSVTEASLRKLGFEVSGEMEPAHYTPEDSPFIQTLLKCYEQYTGQKGECRAMGGSTYVHGIEGGVAFGAGMPGFQSNLHSANERVCIADMLTACKIYAQVIADLCGA